MDCKKRRWIHKSYINLRRIPQVQLPPMIIWSNLKGGRWCYPRHADTNHNVWQRLDLLSLCLSYPFCRLGIAAGTRTGSKLRKKRAISVDREYFHAEDKAARRFSYRRDWTLKLLTLWRLEFIYVIDHNSQKSLISISYTIRLMLLRWESTVCCKKVIGNGRKHGV